ncbi:hypothetical protein GCM10009663_17560 [Kitasatospora arboriphila]|uniref:ABM domain-containing protein n=1 Tax=Kitasatospora arboriphila TaxID=258052 RepID=A0ABN1TDI3_9ACTN
MAVVMSMDWAGVTPEQYDTVRDAVDWEEVPAAGGQVHMAWFDAQGLHVTDVWDSQQAFEAFLAQRLAPAVEKAGITGAPRGLLQPAAPPVRRPGSQRRRVAGPAVAARTTAPAATASATAAASAPAAPTTPTRRRRDGGSPHVPGTPARVHDRIAAEAVPRPRAPPVGRGGRPGRGRGNPLGGTGPARPE